MKFIFYMSLLSYLFFIAIFDTLQFIFQYVILIKKCEQDLVILRHCQLDIKALLSYSLKMAL